MPPRIGFRNNLERDVYQILNKLDAQFTTVSSAYDAIKRSNSSIARLKKRPLEDAIDRVLQIRKQEAQDDESDDSEAALDAPEPAKPQDERFLLNRQMTKLWKTNAKPTDPVGDQPVSKKRRLQADGDAKEDRASGTETPAVEVTTPGKEEKMPLKKTQKPTPFTVERGESLSPNPVGGIDDVLCELCKLTWHALLPRDMSYGPRVSGVLISGPAGMGKRTAVKSLASQLCASLVVLDGCFDNPERMEKSLAEAFDTAISLERSIVFIDDIDQYISRPGASTHGDHHSQARRYLAAQMRRLTSLQQGRVLVTATTSKLVDVDPAIREYGLLEQTLQIRIPDYAARRKILDICTRHLSVADDVDLAALANITHAYVGADIAAVTKLAGLRAAERNLSESIPWRLFSPIMGRDHPDLANGDLVLLDGDASSHVGEDARGPATVTMDDFKAAIASFTPSLRKEGFTVIPSVTWDQVGAMEEARKQLQTSIIGPIKNPDLYRKFGLSRPAGVLLWGPPGCGKTLVAQAVANEAQASFILINGPELLNKYVGESERAVRELFQRARSSAPCILFFDEMDSIVPPRNNSSTDSGARVVNALLTELDGAQDRTGIYVIGTTNRPEMIDEAMLRPGRLSVQLLVDLPTPTERVDILRAVYRTNHEDASQGELDALAAVALDPRCANFSGADLSGLHTKAAENALHRWTAAGGCGPQTIDAADWQHALDNTRASVRDPNSYRLRSA
ncbi:Ribosome bioproteinsis ATPase rix7 [Purpureocillium takamizusanense]|uniref:Peroxisomal ATPase PEX1 n=1 Tax=Purpureocillium takamizusanense TaxID=2060973 RepID=A0A9Q8VBL9_9HYPO|nr:Ribosome biogenesis ATPase rix7 [Purpureocillium takamizusanense]UNI19788.1 Ribosome bioproteinsis ATPase rix7 [Purpureocillium takamizusanense]